MFNMNRVLTKDVNLGTDSTPAEHHVSIGAMLILAKKCKQAADVRGEPGDSPQKESTRLAP